VIYARKFQQAFVLSPSKILGLLVLHWAFLLLNNASLQGQNQLPTVTIGATDANASETGSDPGRFTVSRSGGVSAPLTVKYTIGGTAIHGADYQQLLASFSGSVTDPVGDVQQTTVSNPPDLIFASVTANGGSLTLKVQFVPGTFNSQTTNFQFLLDTDENPSTGHPGSNSGGIDDAGLIGSEYLVNVTRTIGEQAQIYKYAGTVNQFTNTGSYPVTYGSNGAEIAIPLSAIGNDDGNLNFKMVTSSKISATGSTGVLDTMPDVGLPSGRVQGPRSGELTISSIVIPEGSSQATITVTPIVDAQTEGSETVVLGLTADPAYTIGSPRSATVTIADSVVFLPTATISATDSNAAEAGQESGVFTISLSGSTTTALALSYVMTGTAENGQDYSSLPGLIGIPAGSSTATVTVTPIEDTLDEGIETVVLTLQPGASYSLGTTSSATITIADNDLPFVSISATDPDAAEPSNTGTLTLTRTGNTSSPLTVNYAVGGTATGGGDYAALPGAVTIPAGSILAAIVITPNDDASPEPAESVIVTLSATPSYSVGSSGSATVMIADNDQLSLSGVSPGSGPLTGGTPVVISGTGFQNGASVTFGNSPASVQTITPTQIAATTGVGFVPAIVSVTVANLDGRSTTLEKAFTYFLQVRPTLTSLSPMARPEGDPAFKLTVMGRDFASGAQVQWNGSPRVTRFISTAQLEAIIPTQDILTPGTAQVNVLIGGETSLNALTFTIEVNNAQPELTQVLPESGSVQGKTRIRLQGKNFKPSLAGGQAISLVSALRDVNEADCAFSLAGQCITGLSFVSSTEITGDSPAGSAGDASVSLVRDDGSQSTLPQSFTYRTLPPVTTPEPAKTRQRIPFVVDSQEFRTNLGINSLAGTPASVDVLLTNKTGEVVAQKNVPVAARGMSQINDVARFLKDKSDVTGEEGYLILESADSVAAWASQTDNATEDSSMQQSLAETAAVGRLWIPSSASANQYLTSLIVINDSGAAGSVTIRSHREDGTVQAELRDQALAANGYLIFDDFYAHPQVMLSNVSGPIEIVASAGLKITATARIYTPQRTSGYFQGVAPEEASLKVVLPYSVEDAEFRTNLGITNPGDAPASVSVILIGKSGQVINSQTTTVPAHGMKQLNRINDLLSYNGEAYLRLESNVPILGWTAQIDNISNDFSLAVGRAPAAGSSKLLIPSTANKVSATGGRFRSSLVVVNLDTTAANVQLTARDVDGTKRAERSFPIPAEGFVSYADILTSLGLTDNFGPLEVVSSSGNRLRAASRVYSDQRTGGYFEAVPIQSQ
jgi:hypothetical protein